MKDPKSALLFMNYLEGQTARGSQVKFGTPKMRGWELDHAPSQRKRTFGIPVLALSDEPDVVEELSDAYFDEMLAKVGLMRIPK